MSNYSSLFRVLSPSRVQTKFEEKTLPARYTDIMVFCLVQGDAIKNSFPIDTSSHKTVGHLKKAIKDAKQNAFSGIDADKLILWRVNIVQSKENQEMTIKEHKGVELHSFEPVETHFQEKPFSTDIRIIIEPPVSTGKRRAEVDEENVGHLKKEKLIDLTPESIVEFLMDQEGLKTDFSKPHSLCTNRYKFQRKGREESFYRAYDFILDQYLDIHLDENDSFDKLYFPLFAIQSAPGGGKSFFLDEFASLKSEDLNRFIQEKSNDEDAKHVMDELRNSVSICVTYNGNSVYNPNIDGDADEIGLVMRIIWSYFFDATKLPWDLFYEKFQIKFRSLHPSMAIESIMHHSGKSTVLLCIDEIMKIDNENHSNILNLLASLYTSYHRFAYHNKETDERGFKFRFIISTLDAIRLWDYQTQSGRDINWIPLKRLEFSESVELFSGVMEKLNLKRVYIINKCISDCNGHPRTLEKLYELINNNNTALETNNFTTLIEELTKKISHWFNDITFSVVKLALLGEHVSLKETVEVNNEHLSIKDLIASGIYINSVTEKTDTSRVIPTLTLVSLYYFCMINVENRDRDVKTVAKILKNFFHTEDYFDLRSNDGKAFEEFHMNWELLYRALHEDGMEIDLPKIYGLDDEGVTIRIQRKNIIELQKDIEFPSNCIRDRKGNIIDDLEKYIFVPTKSNNSGFEMVIFERKAREGYIAINVECKYSWPDSKTTLSSKEIRDKYEKMRNKYLGHVKSEPPMVTRSKNSQGLIDSKTCVGELGMTIDDIYLILVVWRDISELDKDIMNNENIIIVKKKNLEKIYSPSLVSRAQFYSEIQKKIEN